MAPLKSLKSDITQKQWLRACKKLGLSVNVRRGHGSHARVYMPNNPALPPITRQHKIYRPVSIEIYKALLAMGFTEAKIDKALK